MTPGLAVAFDWGGVLTHGTFDGRTTARIAEAHARPLGLVREHYFALVRHLEVGDWTLERFWAELSPRLELEAPFAPFRELFLGGITANAEMFDLAAGLRGRVRLGLLSNNYPEVSAALRRDPRFAIFDALVFSNEIGVKKPDAAAFSALNVALDVPPERTAFVDDTQENLDAAERLGYRGLLFDTLEGFRPRLDAWLRREGEGNP